MTITTSPPLSIYRGLKEYTKSDEFFFSVGGGPFFFLDLGFFWGVDVEKTEAPRERFLKRRRGIEENNHFPAVLQRARYNRFTVAHAHTHSLARTRTR